MSELGGGKREEARTVQLALVLLRILHLAHRLHEIVLHNVVALVPVGSLSTSALASVQDGREGTNRMANMPDSVATFLRSAPLNPSDS